VQKAAVHLGPATTMSSRVGQPWLVRVLSRSFEVWLGAAAKNLGRREFAPRSGDPNWLLALPMPSLSCPSCRTSFPQKATRIKASACQRRQSLARKPQRLFLEIASGETASSSSSSLIAWDHLPHRPCRGTRQGSSARKRFPSLSRADHSIPDESV